MKKFVAACKRDTEDCLCLLCREFLCNSHRNCGRNSTSYKVFYWYSVSEREN